MNTFPDQLEIDRAMQLLVSAEPTFKTNPLPRDPAAAIFYEPAAPRRALFDMGSIFNQDAGDQSSTGTPPIQLPTFSAYAGVFENGVPVQRLVSVYGTVA